MTKDEVALAIKLRAEGVADAEIARRFDPPVSRQHINSILGPVGKRSLPHTRENEPGATPICYTPSAYVNGSYIKTGDFAKYLSSWRKRLKLTQREAGEVLRVSQIQISFWETERSRCSLPGPMMLLMDILENGLDKPLERS